MHEAVHHFPGARSTPGPRRGWTGRLVEMPFCRVFNRDQKKKEICLDFPGYKALSVLVSVLGDIQGPQCQGNYC